MSLITLLSRNRPSIDTITFDAILEETLEIESEVTTYTIESGAPAADHRIYKPVKWRVIGGVSNNPVRVQATDFTGVVSRATNDPVANLALGASAGLLSGTRETAAADFIQEVIRKGFNAPAFDVVTDDVMLHDMVFVAFRRTNDTENEGALIFEAELQELPTIERIRQSGGALTSVTNPSPEDPSAASIGNAVNFGQRSLRSAGQAVNTAVNNALEFIDPDRQT